MNRLSSGAFQEVVDHGGNEHLIADFLDLQEAVVGIHDLFEVHRAPIQVRKRRMGVKAAVQVAKLGLRFAARQVNTRKNASRKVATHREKVQRRHFRLMLGKRLTDFGEVLVLKRLVNRDVAAAPTKMRSIRQRTSRASRACNGMNMSRLGE